MIVPTQHPESKQQPSSSDVFVNRGQPPSKRNHNRQNGKAGNGERWNVNDRDGRKSWKRRQEEDR
jgi:hypothetical protein